MDDGRYILDDNDEPVPCPELLTWGQWYENSYRTGSRQIARTLCEGLYLSTIFLALDHNLHFPGPPVLWETMLFVDDFPDDPALLEFDQEQWRYHTKEEALKSHEQIVEDLRLRGYEPLVKETVGHDEE